MENTKQGQGGQKLEEGATIFFKSGKDIETQRITSLMLDSSEGLDLIEMWIEFKGKHRPKDETGLMGLTRAELELNRKSIALMNNNATDQATKDLIDKIDKKLKDDIDTIDILSDNLDVTTE